MTYDINIFMVMNWSELITDLTKEFRKTIYEIATDTGITHSALFRLRDGLTKKPYPATIKKLEEYFKIRINDNDPENITYSKIETRKEVNEYEIINTQLHEYPVLTHVYAGLSPENILRENIVEYVYLPYHKKSNCFAVKVFGDSMNHSIQEGNLILVDTDRTFNNNDLVVARLKSGKQIIKHYKELNQEFVMFYSSNENYEPLTIAKTEIEAIYRAVGIWKQI